MSGRSGQSAGVPPPTPLAIPPGASRVLLVGGTFDPPHMAHRAMAEAGRAFLDRDGGMTHVVYVPAARSPFKPAPVASDGLRVEMVRALAGGSAGAGVWTDEIDRSVGGAPSYWVETLERAHAAIMSERLGEGRGGALPGLHFLIGADQAIALHRWRSARRVLELAGPVIVLRPPVAARDVLARALLEARFWNAAEVEYLVSRIAPAELMEASATGIREALARGQMVPDVPAGVLAVLARENPYQRG